MNIDKQTRQQRHGLWLRRNPFKHRWELLGDGPKVLAWHATKRDAVAHLKEVIALIEQASVDHDMGHSLQEVKEAAWKSYSE